MVEERNHRRHIAAQAMLVAVATLLPASCCGRGTCPGNRPVPTEDAASEPEAAADPAPALAPDPADIAEPAADAPEGPQAIVTTVPDIPGGPCPGESQCTVTLRPPAGGRRATWAAEGATLTFAYDDALGLARERNERELVAFLEGRPAGEDPVPLNEAALAGNRVSFVVAALLDEGQAAVRDDQGDRDVATIVRETWVWTGCSGGCRQAGRQYRIQVPGDVFFRTTDLFEDSF